ncbi:MAG: hypothetical protein U7127_31550 (plasmid) [Phormidium sp.]
MLLLLLKKASVAIGRENSRKLWKRLLLNVVPPSMLKVFPCWITIDQLGNVASGTIWACTMLTESRNNSRLVKGIAQ